MEWSLDDSKLIYGIGRNDMEFLDISEEGYLEIIYENSRISIKEVISRISKISELQNQKVQSFTLRIPQLVNYQISKIVRAFQKAISHYNYNGIFQPLYPIKVNQSKKMVDAVLESDPNYGLEAGTKSELILVIKALQKQKNRLIMCNGVKDRDYILIVNQAIRDGYRIIISVESIKEVKLVCDILPLDQLELVLRIKPYVDMQGYWGLSSGRHSKFGVGIAELMEILELLKMEKIEDKLSGIHAHPGSQVENFKDLKKYIEFMTNTFVQIKEKGFEAMQIINLGGGLPIDYDSSLDPNKLEKYFNMAISKIEEILTEKNFISLPTIMIEAGRAITALSSMIIVKPISIHRVFPQEAPSNLIPDIEEMILEATNISSREEIDKLLNSWDQYCIENNHTDLISIYASEYYYGKLIGVLRASTYRIGLVSELIQDKKYEDLFKSDCYLLGNFSVFNSVADHVMVNQYFPVFTIDNLHVQPETIMRLVDLTCDSDGEISAFNLQVNTRALFTNDKFPLTHPRALSLSGFPVANRELLNTFIAIPLVGAYQDVIGFDHNLIGDLPDVELILEDDLWKVNLVGPSRTIDDFIRELGY